MLAPQKGANVYLPVSYSKEKGEEAEVLALVQMF